MTPLFPALDNIVIRAFRLIRQFEGFSPGPERDLLLEQLFPKAVERWRSEFKLPTAQHGLGRHLKLASFYREGIRVRSITLLAYKFISG